MGDGLCVPTSSSTDVRDDTDLKDTSTIMTTLSSSTADSETMDTDIHEPTGHHLLVDLEYVDAAFLRSEIRIAQAMVDLIQASSMTMLSYHCHSAEESNDGKGNGGSSSGGVSCVGVLMESHVSVHTWPRLGRLALDLFSCGPHSIIPLLSVIETLFGIPSAVPPLAASTLSTAVTNRTGRASAVGQDSRSDSVSSSPSQPHMVWSYKARGFRPSVDSSANAVLDADINWLVGFMHVDKTHVATVTTDYQRIDIYDMTEPRLEIVDRVVFLDGIIQSRSLGEHAYHEALVHPALFCHDHPRRVVIIGGGEGATLREVLKHKTLEQVIMVEIDKGMVDTSREYLPEWSYCGDLEGSAESCFDDPRASVYYTDAIAWFIERYGAQATIEEADMLDVIIMDAL
jgi:S-adenosylmethionine/arginine decarboxylase-like enzyme